MNLTLERLHDELVRREYKIQETIRFQEQRKKQIIELEQLVINCTAGVRILTDVLAVVQERTLKYIEDTVTSALQYVYDDSYSFQIKYELKRGQPEVALEIVKNGIVYDNPAFFGGVGVLDVVSFVLRCVCWSLGNPKSAPVMMLDEPFSSLHGRLENEKMSVLVKELSEQLGIQIIIISGETALSEYADKIFTVYQNDGISYVEEKKNN